MISKLCTNKSILNVDVTLEAETVESAPLSQPWYKIYIELHLVSNFSIIYKSFLRLRLDNFFNPESFLYCFQFLLNLLWHSFCRLVFFITIFAWFIKKFFKECKETMKKKPSLRKSTENLVLHRTRPRWFLT